MRRRSMPTKHQLVRQQIWKPLTRRDSRWGLRSNPGDPARGHFFKWGACRGGGWGQPPGREWGETGEKRPAVSDPCRGSDLELTSHLSKQSNNQVYPGVVTARGQRHLREAYSRSVALPRRELTGNQLTGRYDGSRRNAAFGGWDCEVHGKTARSAYTSSYRPSLFPRTSPTFAFS